MDKRELRSPCVLQPDRLAQAEVAFSMLPKLLKSARTGPDRLKGIGFTG